MRRLLTLTAIIEVPTGLAFLCCPPATLALLLGPGLDAFAAVALGRVAGVALVALGVACWLAQYDAQSCAARGLVSAMALYDFGVVVIFATAIGSHPSGVAFWPAIILHGTMAVWCIASLLRKT